MEATDDPDEFLDRLPWPELGQNPKEEGGDMA